MFFFGGGGGGGLSLGNLNGGGGGAKFSLPHHILKIEQPFNLVIMG